MNISGLINQAISNPYIFWPAVSESDIISFYIEKINEEFSLAKNFIFENDLKTFLFFQVLELPWDSRYFGYKCSTIKHLYVDESLHYNVLDEIIKKIKPSFIEFCKKEKIKFIFSDVGSLNKNSIYFIQELGFKFILNWTDGQWISNLMDKNSPEILIDTINSEEVKVFSEIAQKDYFKGGRFYLDNRFDPLKADKLYSELIINSYNDNDIMLICRDEGKPIGLLICKQIRTYIEFKNLRVAPLRFFLIAPDYRNNSLGFNFFKAGLNFLASKSDLIFTGFESHNAKSMNLHSRLGCKFTYSHNAFHFWNYL